MVTQKEWSIIPKEIYNPDYLAKKLTVLFTTSPIGSNPSTAVIDEVFNVGDEHPCVTVFGASRAVKGDPVYSVSEEVGTALAKLGYIVINGGYTGVMEATAEGARAAGGRAYGIVVPSVFLARHATGGANKFLTGAVPEPSLTRRVDMLCHGANGKGIAFFVVMPGTLGTLHEFITIWDESSIARFSGELPPIIFAWRDPWEKLAHVMHDSLDMRCPELIDRIIFVDSADDLVAKIAANKASIDERIAHFGASKK